MALQVAVLASAGCRSNCASVATGLPRRCGWSARCTVTPSQMTVSRSRSRNTTTVSSSPGLPKARGKGPTGVRPAESGSRRVTRLVQSSLAGLHRDSGETRSASAAVAIRYRLHSTRRRPVPTERGKTQHSGKAARQNNYRRSLYAHACDETGHELCGGPPGDHVCVRHTGLCGYWDDEGQGARWTREQEKARLAG
jgi:hypothetical protein